jgi:phosphoribosylanthranilate isomerase
LLDTYSSTDYGGTGKTFNWDQIPQEVRKNIILAGGITVENLEYIFETIAPDGIDLSSSLEQIPGKKNPQKLIKFLNKFNELKLRKEVNTEKRNEE